MEVYVVQCELMDVGECGLEDGGDHTLAVVSSLEKALEVRQAHWAADAVSRDGTHYRCNSVMRIERWVVDGALREESREDKTLTEDSESGEEPDLSFLDY